MTIQSEWRRKPQKQNNQTNNQKYHIIFKLLTIMDLPTRPTGVKWGLYLGLASVVLSAIQFGAGILEGTVSTLMTVLSYGLMIGFIFLAIKEYKSANEGFLKLGQGVMVSLWTSLLSGLIGGAFMAIYTGVIDPSLREKMVDIAMKDAEKNAAGNADAIEMATSMVEFMTSPGMLAFMGIIGSVIVGVIIGLIVSAILKNDRPPEIV